MKTRAVFEAGELRVVVRSDGGVYVARPSRVNLTGGFDFIDPKDMLRVGSTAPICDALAEAFKQAAEFKRKVAE